MYVVYLRIIEKCWLENKATVTILHELGPVEHVGTVTLAKNSGSVENIKIGNLLKVESHHLTPSIPHGERI